MEFNIFPMFYPLHRTYPNIFTIFGSAHNFLHKIKHNLNLHKKEKEKRHCAAGGPAARLAGRPIRSAHALRAPSPTPLTMPLTVGRRCQHRPSPRRRLGCAPGRRWRGSSPRDEAQRLRLSFATPLTLPTGMLPPLPTLATHMADGGTGRT